MIILLLLPLSVYAVEVKTPLDIYGMVAFPAFKIISALVMLFGMISVGFALHNDDQKAKIHSLGATIGGAIVLTLCLTTEPLFSNLDTSGTPVDYVASDQAAADTANLLTNPIAKWIPIFGFSCMCFGFCNLYFYLRDDNHQKKNEALMEIGAGLVLWQIVNFLNWVLFS